ncbi:hypothetical protein BD779DRAFT_1529853 [Infundibulicybe gibba]|nr:hypothetical protein BD779DRAFT_1529853 [Infundibulicybe gibba]
MLLSDYSELPPLPPQFLNKAADATPEFIENGFLAFWSAYRDYFASRGISSTFRTSVCRHLL